METYTRVFRVVVKSVCENEEHAKEVTDAAKGLVETHIKDLLDGVSPCLPTEVLTIGINTNGYII